MEDGFGVAGANRACGQALTGPPVIADNEADIVGYQ